MKNSLGREIPSGFAPFQDSTAYKQQKRKLIPQKKTSKGFERLDSMAELFDKVPIKSGMTISMHHHLRDGDFVVNMVCEEIKRRNLTNIKLAASGIFPSYRLLAQLIENGNITDIYTNYANGAAAKQITDGNLKGMLVMHTHGGRARAIEAGEIDIDVAILATPTVDSKGNGTGLTGKSACGSLGYAVSDLLYAKKVVLVTDNTVESIENPQFDGKFVDYVLKVDAIGDPKGIVSGTTRVTKDPIGLKIAKDTVALLTELNIITNDFSMQTGAGGTSLAVAHFVKQYMQENNIKGSFVSGGITGYFTEMLEQGLFEKLYDVQCFDLSAVNSARTNAQHCLMSASQYANPFDDNIADKLDFVILGAAEIDTSFNVNVSTDSHGTLIGGSGGHSDTAHGAKLTVVVTNLIKARMPIIKKSVTTITTPGEDIDVLVTERGIAINPKRTDLWEKLKHSKLKIHTIEELLSLAHSITGEPKESKREGKPVGVVVYRDGTVIDTIYSTK